MGRSSSSLLFINVRTISFDARVGENDFFGFLSSTLISFY